MFASIPDVRIAAVRAAVPAREIRIDDEAEFYGNDPRKVERARRMIGTDRRRVASPGQTASDLCAAAARHLLDSVPRAGEADALVLVTQSPDFDEPATACTLQHRLGLPRSCAAFDVNQGCAGWVYGLWIAAGLIAGGCHRVLLLAGDVPCRPRDPRNRVMAPIFGDGGSAALLEREPGAPPLRFSIGTDGSGFAHIIRPGGRARLPFSADFEENRPFFEDIVDGRGQPWRLCDTHMNGEAVFGFTMQVVPEHIREFLARCQVRPEEISRFVPHQANGQIIREIARLAGFSPEQAVGGAFGRYGNLSSASIPAALCDLFGGTEGDGGDILLCGYGIGLSWASCLWPDARCDFAPILNAPEPDPAMLPGAQLEFWRRHLRGESQ